MKFLICGIGSIGQRHYRNLKSLGQEVAIYRSGTASRYHADFLKEFFQEQEAAGAPVRAFYEFESAVEEFKPDAVFIANPNARHMDIALPAARRGLPLFIEKPVSDVMDSRLAELEDIGRRGGVKILVGYNLRFHPLLLQMREMVKSGRIGKPLAAHIETGENVENWHPWEDYRKAYAVWRDGGGGVVLCFSHDIDYLYWFFGDPKTVSAVGGKITPLGGDAEDMIKALMRFDGGPIASVHLDYWQWPPRRIFEVVGEKGKLFWDYYAKTLTVFPRDSAAPPEVIAEPAGFQRNDMFLAEAQHFLEVLEGRAEPLVPLAEGIAVLKISQAIKSRVGF